MAASVHRAETRGDNVCIRIDPELRTELERRAERDDRSLSSFIRIVLRNAVERDLRHEVATQEQR